MKARLLFFILAIFSVGLFAEKANATTYYWTNYGGDNNWKNANNWSITQYYSTVSGYPGNSAAGDVAEISVYGIGAASGMAPKLASTLNYSISQIYVDALTSGTLTLANSLTLTVTNGIYVSGTYGGYTAGLTITGPGTVNVSGNSTLYYYATLSIGSQTTINIAAGNNLTFSNNNCALTNAGTLNFNGTSSSKCAMPPYTNATITNSGTIYAPYTDIIDGGNSVSFNNSGTFTTTNSTITLSQSSFIANTGTCSFTGNTINLTSNSSYLSNTSGMTINSSTVNMDHSTTYITNSSTGTINTSGTTYNLSASNNSASAASYVANNGTFNATSSCAFKMTGQYDQILNSGSSAKFTLDASSISITTNNLQTLINQSGGTFTAKNGSTISISSYSGYINNAASSTFVAGISGSACTINISGTSPSSSTSSLTNSGTFTLGPTSIINNTGTDSSNPTKVANSGTFTIQSDATGSGAIGPLGAGASFTGSYIVQRYMSGGSRNYRYMSSPIGAALPAFGGKSAFGVSELQNKMFITGWGTGTGFTKAVPSSAFDATTIGNPSVFFYYEPDKDPNTRAIGKSDYKAFSSIGDKLPVGNGFLIFYRGNRNITDASGVSKALTTATPEADTLTNTGALNQGSIVVYIPTDPRTTSSTPSAGTVYVYSTAQAASTLSSTFVKTNNSSTANDGLHLVGNPYACPIDLDKLVNGSGTALSGSAYTLSTGGVMTAHVFGSGSLTGRYVEQGQGFMVSGTVTSLTFTESAKYATPSFLSGEFFQASKLVAAQPVTNTVLTVKLKADTNELSSNETTIAFTNKKDIYDPTEDAYYQYGQLQTNYMASYTSDGQPCIVNQMNSLDSIKSIKLYAEGSTTGLYSLTFTGAKSVDPRYKLWLMDSFKADSLDLSSNTVYNFNIDRSIPATYGDSRFTIKVAKTNIAAYYHLQSFNGIKNNAVVNLNWSTQYEGNYTTFTLQRSTDGGTTYDDLAIIQSNGAGNYQFTDTKPSLSGNNLYRLKQNNIDDVNSYSKIVTIGYQPIDLLTDKLWLYPNPTIASIKMILKDVKASSLVVSVYNTSGNLMLTNNVTATTTVVQDVSKLQKGTYIVQITGSDNKSYGVGKFTKL